MVILALKLASVPHIFLWCLSSFRLKIPHYSVILNRFRIFKTFLEKKFLMHSYNTKSHFRLSTIGEELHLSNNYLRTTAQEVLDERNQNETWYNIIQIKKPLHIDKFLEKMKFRSTAYIVICEHRK